MLKVTEKTANTTAIRPRAVTSAIPVTFPKKVNTDKVKAEFKDGMLKITAAIAEEQKARRVEIAAA